MPEPPRHSNRVFQALEKFALTFSKHWKKHLDPFPILGNVWKKSDFSSVESLGETAVLFAVSPRGRFKALLAAAGTDAV